MYNNGASGMWGILCHIHTTQPNNTWISSNQINPSVRCDLMWYDGILCHIQHGQCTWMSSNQIEFIHYILCDVMENHLGHNITDTTLSPPSHSYGLLREVNYWCCSTGNCSSLISCAQSNFPVKYPSQNRNFRIHFFYNHHYFTKYIHNILQK